MTKRITSDETNVWLDDYFRQRRDFGFCKAIAKITLHPPNPFKSQARRLPRSGFLFAAGLLACAAAWFFYLNFMR